ncbi:MAG TPA: hypothetical protein VFG75_07955 [Gaiella sp.]|nr:hypothetical protein [Gaiella sp.]
MSPEVQVVLMNRARAHSPMLAVCPVLGCSTITMGGTCVEHDEPVTTVFPRGRPYAPSARGGEIRVVGGVLRDLPG